MYLRCLTQEFWSGLGLGQLGQLTLDINSRLVGESSFYASTDPIQPPPYADLLFLFLINLYLTKKVPLRLKKRLFQRSPYSSLYSITRISPIAAF